MPRIGRSIPGTYGYIVPVVILGTPSQARTSALNQQNAVANRLLPPYRRTMAVLNPPTVVTPAAVFVAPPIEVRTVRTRPRRTTYVLGRPTTLRVFTGPESWLTRARPRPTTHVLRPAAVVLNPGNEQRIRTLRVALVRGRPGKTDYRLQPPTVVTAAVVTVYAAGKPVLVRGRAGKTIYRLEPPVVLQTFAGSAKRTVTTRPRRTTRVLFPPAVVTAAAVFVAPPLRIANVHTRPVRTVRALRPPTTLQVFTGPRSVLTRARPRPTVHALRPAAVVLVPSVELKEETIRVALVRGRASKTDYRLNPPTVVFAPAVFAGPTSRLVRIRPAHTTARLSPPAVVAPRPLAPPLQSRLVRTRPRHTVYRLEPPTTLAVFPGPRSEITRVRPQPTTTALVPAQVVRNPHVEQQLRTLRVRLVRARPQPTTTLLRPPAVVLTPIPPEIDIHTAIVRGRRPIAKSRLFRPATLEPFSIQLREQTIRVRLVQIRPRHTTLKLRPPTVLAVLRFSTGKPVLVRARPRDTVATLRGPVVLRTFATGETRLVTTRPRATTTLLRPPAVVRFRPEVTKVRSALVTARPRPTTRLLRPPAALRVFAGPVARLTRIRPRHTIARLNRPTVVTPFVAPVSASIRAVLARIRPPRTLAQLFPPRRLKNVPGHACLTDQLANQACLTDQLAAEACLEDAELSTEACLTDQAQAVACLVDMSVATATLRDEE